MLNLALQSKLASSSPPTLASSLLELEAERHSTVQKKQDLELQNFEQLTKGQPDFGVPLVTPLPARVPHITAQLASLKLKTSLTVTMFLHLLTSCSGINLNINLNSCTSAPCYSQI